METALLKKEKKESVHIQLPMANAVSLFFPKFAHGQLFSIPQITCK